MTPVPSLAGIATPSRRVVATALRPPLQLSHSVLEFNLPSGYFELGIESGAGRAQVSEVCFTVLIQEIFSDNFHLLKLYISVIVLFCFLFDLQRIDGEITLNQAEIVSYSFLIIS